MLFFNSSATSSLNEANESSEDNNLTVPLISKSATFATTFLASDKCVSFLEAVRITKINLNLLKICLTAYGTI
jgi:hypothetical protein